VFNLEAAKIALVTAVNQLPSTGLDDIVGRGYEPEISTQNCDMCGFTHSIDSQLNRGGALVGGARMANSCVG
jgi:hypothetical protein